MSQSGLSRERYTDSVATTRLHLDHRLRDLVGQVSAFLSARDVFAYATGGFMRDVLLGITPQDVDISIDVDPLAVGPELAAEFGATYFPLDEERRHARIIFPDQDLHVDLLPLRDEIETDLRSRDYTVDAMAAALADVLSGSTTIIDPVGGCDDLEAGLVRLVSEQALIDDPLRVLRGPRIAIERGFTIEPATEQAIRRRALSLSSTAAERQRDELMRMMKTPRAGAAFRVLDSLGVLPVLMPEAEVMRGVEQPKEHHWDVLGHAFACTEMLDILLAESGPAAERDLWHAVWDELDWWDGAEEYLDGEIVAGTPRRAIIKLCGFLHDIGKPQTKSFEENGRMRFFGHSEAGAEIAGALMRRLRFSSREVTIVKRMIDAHLRPVQMAQQGPPSDRAVFRYFRATGDAGIATLVLSIADHLATVGPRRNLDAVREHARLISYILHKRVEEERVVSPPKLVRGDDLIRALGLEPGPQIGELLAAIEEAQAAGEVDTPEQALAFARRHVDTSASRDQAPRA